MFLNNTQHKHRIANDTIGILTDIDLTPELIYVSFCVEGAIDNVKIHSLNCTAFMVDPSMINEYERLERIARNLLPLTSHQTE